VRSAFELRRDAAVEGRTVILVDDVVTTGATLAAAARPLERAGAASIIGIALARAE
jgi:predicted amidophosphoribosyltransferase